MENLLGGLPGWLLVLLGAGYIIRIEVRNRNGGGPEKRALEELVEEMREFNDAMRTWMVVHHDTAKRTEETVAKCYEKLMGKR